MNLSRFNSTSRTLSGWRRAVFVLFACSLALISNPAVLSAQTTVLPEIAPNSVVPPEFATQMDWSEEGGWHWVTISHDGSQRLWTPHYDVSFGIELSNAYFVATKVRTLAANDHCHDCLLLNDNEQGPPSILGGPENPALKPAYDNIENGMRRQLLKDYGIGDTRRWTNGSWYLNYSPITGTFFSWTWVPEDWTEEAHREGRVPNRNIVATVPEEVENQQAAQLAATVPTGTRVFPIAGDYHLTQGFGCVPVNPGYATSEFCPAETPSFHDGIDFGMPPGTPILAAASGTVTFASVDPNNASGNSVIIIEHDGSSTGFSTQYLHWQLSYVSEGQHVSAGEPIAEVGSVGYSTGPHLHFAVYDSSTGESLDPLRWLQANVDLATVADEASGAYEAGVLRWAYFIEDAAARHNVSGGLLAAIMTVESGGNPNAVSPAGAQGLMQIMPDQLTRLGVSQELWLDPATNIDAGARYLAETFSTGGTVEQAIARYFGIGCDVLGTCTDVYMARVLEWYAHYALLFP